LNPGDDVASSVADSFHSVHDSFGSAPASSDEPTARPRGGSFSRRLTETARLLRNVKNVFRRTTTRVDLEVELSHGYAFSQEEGGVVPQASVIRAYDTTRPKPTGM